MSENASGVVGIVGDETNDENQDRGKSENTQNVTSKRQGKEVQSDIMCKLSSAGVPRPGHICLEPLLEELAWFESCWKCLIEANLWKLRKKNNFFLSKAHRLSLIDFVSIPDFNMFGLF